MSNLVYAHRVWRAGYAAASEHAADKHRIAVELREEVRKQCAARGEKALEMQHRAALMRANAASMCAVLTHMRARVSKA